MGTSGQSARLPSLLGLRFVAAFLVFFFHVHAHGVFAGEQVFELGQRVFANGPSWLAFFFVLSGFALTWGTRPSDTARDIWRRRASRIVPSHVVMWLVTVLALVYAGHTVTAGTVLPGLVLLQAWVPAQDVYFAANTPAWSLSCEIAFYAAFPLLLRVVAKVADRWLWPLLGALLVGILLVSVLGALMPPALGAWFVAIFPPARLLEFMVGIVLARIVLACRWPKVGLWLPTMLLPAGLIASWYLPAPLVFVLGTVIPVALFIPAAAAADLTGARSPWRNRTLVRLGELAFAFYLVHQLVIRSVDHLLGRVGWPFSEGVLVVLAMFTISLACAWVLHSAVERPIVRYIAVRRAGRIARPPVRRSVPALEEA